MGLSVRPMNYAIDNFSRFSDAYSKSVKAASRENRVGAVAPVSYPNATVEANQAYNAVASNFENQTIGYSAQSTALQYGQTGSNFDMYA